MLLTPEIDTSETLDVTDTADVFTTEMAAGEIWIYTCTVASWIKQGAANDVTASAATGSMFVGAGVDRILEPGFSQGGFLSAIREGGASGKATLTRMRVRPAQASND